MNKKTLITGFVLLAIGFGLGAYVNPGKLIENNKVEKDTKSEQTTTVKEETRADGTKIKETTTTTRKEDSTKKENTKIVENNKPNWKAGVMAGYNFDRKEPVYGVQVDRRILGNIFVGGTVTTDKQVFANISMEF